jgi:16S rRNA (uracil1498-N3)-methyltransferase
MQLFFAKITQEQFELDPSEVVHCTKVLRKGIGDQIHFITGDGNLYQGVIDHSSKKAVSGPYTLVESDFGKVEYRLDIAIAPTKNNDRIEWFIEKSTELGIRNIHLLRCDRSERKNVNVDRFQKIAVSAAKQSLKGAIPTVNDMVGFAEFVEKHPGGAIAHCMEGERTAWPKHIESNKGQSHVLLIGPEGDFTPDEVALAREHGFTPIHLGESRLRTETAALSAVAMVYAAELV